MLTVRVQTTGFPAWQKYLKGMERQLPYATMLALNQTAEFAQGMVKAETRKVFDRPTHWAINASFVKYAKKYRLEASVALKGRDKGVVDRETNFLYPEVYGVARGRKAMETALLRAGALRSNEFLVPAEDLPLDPFGNVPVKLIRQILSQLKAAEKNDAGYSANKTTSVRSRRTVAKAGTFFVPPPRSGLPRGIYQRVKTGFGWATRMVFKIVVGKPKYRKRLDFYAIGQQAYNKHFAREFDTAWQRALATARI